MSDSDRQDDLTTSVDDLKMIVAEFVGERDWKQFHSPKNLSMALAVEAAELMEHFQWISMQESRELESVPEKLDQVAEEMSDVLCYLLALANELGIDVSKSMRSKMVTNRKKYPVDVFKGKYGKEDL